MIRLLRAAATGAACGYLNGFIGSRRAQQRAIIIAALNQQKIALYACEQLLNQLIAERDMQRRFAEIAAMYDAPPAGDH